MPQTPVPARTDAVVVGAGCMGASVAFHLARRGVEVVLLEKEHIASGATGHSGAIVRQHYETRLGARLARRSLAFFERFREETGSSAGFRTTGFLSGARTRDLTAFDALFDLLKSEGVRVERLDAREATALEPALDAADYAAVVHDPEAGYADPIATAEGFASAAKRDGAAVLEGVRVGGLILRKGRVAGVRLRGGMTIASDRVVLATGNWTPAFARTAGVRLPIRFVHGEVAILRRPRDFGASPRIHFDFYHRTYSRPDGNSDTLVGYMARRERVLRRHELADDSVPGPTVRDLRRRLAVRFPSMARAQPRGGWAGVYDVTPDEYPIVDRVGPAGLFVAVGLSGHGFKLSPEIGRHLAEFIAADRKSPELEALAASRFARRRPIRPEAPFPARRGARIP